MTVAKKTPVAGYACGLCRKPCEAKVDSALALLQLCAECQDKRYATGLAAQRTAEVARV